MKRLKFDEVVAQWEEKGRFFRLISEKGSLKNFMANFIFSPDHFFIFTVDEYLKEYDEPAKKTPLQFVTTEIEKLYQEYNLAPESETGAFFSSIVRYMLCAQMAPGMTEAILDEDTNHFSTDGKGLLPFIGPFEKVPSVSFTGKPIPIFQLEPVNGQRYLISYSKSGRLLSVIQVVDGVKQAWVPPPFKAYKDLISS